LWLGSGVREAEDAEGESIWLDELDFQRVVVSCLHTNCIGQFLQRCGVRRCSRIRSATGRSRGGGAVEVTRSNDQAGEHISICGSSARIERALDAILEVLGGYRNRLAAGILELDH